MTDGFARSYPVDSAGNESAGQETKGSIFLRRLYHAFPAPPSTNYLLRQVGGDLYDLLPDGALLVDIGSGPARGNYSAITERSPRSRRLRFVGVDLEQGPGVLVRGDAHRLPFVSGRVDCLTCVSTIEYLHRPELAVAEMYRVLKPGGILYLSAPFVFPYHPPPEDYCRFSPAGLRALARDFDEMQTGSNRGPASTFAQILVQFIAVALCFNSKRLYGILLDASKWSLFWIKYLDRWIGGYDVGCGLYGNAFFVGRKPMNAQDRTN